jgi:hypothetical protein
VYSSPFVNYFWPECGAWVSVLVPPRCACNHKKASKLQVACATQVAYPNVSVVLCPVLVHFYGLCFSEQLAANPHL